MSMSRFWPALSIASLAAVGTGCPKPATKLPEGTCDVSIRAALSYAADGGVQSVDATEAGDTGIRVQAGQVANLLFYYTSQFDFQYQSNLSHAENGLVARTLVPTQFVDVPADEKSIYIYDVIPVDTTGLLGTYSVNVGGHVVVNPDDFHCTGPLDSTGHVTVSTWRSLGLQVDPVTSSSGGASSSASLGSSSAAGSSSSGT